MSKDFQIDKTSNVPLYKQVKEYILRLINGSEYGSLVLPPEIEIVRKFDISRTTVRSAYMELVSEDVLERVPGKGTFIKERPNTLHFANWHSTEKPTAAPILDIVREFNTIEKDGFIESLGINYENIERQLIVMATGGEAPDIASLIYHWTPLLAFNGALEPLDNLYSPAFMLDQYEQTIEGVFFEGNMYGVNWVNAPTIMVYHKDILSEYTGSKELHVEYYDELTELFIRIHEGSSGEIIPFSIPILDDELFFVFILSNFLHSFNGGIYAEDGSIIFNSGETRDAFIWLKNFIQKGHINISNSLEKNRKMLSVGKLAFLLEGPWMKSIISTFRGDDDLSDIGYSPLPKSPKGISRSVLWNHTLSVFRQCKNRELAEKFIEYLVTDKSITEQYYQKTGCLPILRSEIEKNPIYNDELGKVLKSQMNTAYSIKVHDPSTFNLSVAICAKAAREILIGDTDIETTLNQHAIILKALKAK